MDVSKTVKEMGLRIAIARRSQNLSQNEVADFIGMKRPNYVQIENGNSGRYLKDFQLVKLCEKLKVSADYILGTEKPISIEIPEITDKYGLTEQTLKNLEHLNNFKKNIFNQLNLKSPIDTINKILSENIKNGTDIPLIVLIDSYLNTKIPNNYLLSFQGDIVQLFDDFKKVPNKHYGGQTFLTGDLLIKGILVEIENKLIKMKEEEKNECKGTRKK